MAKSAAKPSPFAPARLPEHAGRAGRAPGGLRGRHSLPGPHRPDGGGARSRHGRGGRADPLQDVLGAGAVVPGEA